MKILLKTIKDTHNHIYHLFKISKLPIHIWNNYKKYKKYRIFVKSRESYCPNQFSPQLLYKYLSISISWDPAMDKYHSQKQWQYKTQLFWFINPALKPNPQNLNINKAYTIDITDYSQLSFNP